jgi:single-strand DNA-binding protein
MSSVNIIIIMGNLTRDPQLKYLPSQTPVCEFGVATNRRFKTADGEDREEVCFLDCVSYGKRADVMNQYLTKGSPVFIEGHLKYESWEDKNGGGKRSKVVVIVDKFEFVGGGGGNGGDNGGDGGDYPDGGGQSRNPPPRQSGNRPAPRGNAPPPHRSNAPPPHRQQRGGPPAENPFGNEETFAEDDIPF